MAISTLVISGVLAVTAGGLAAGAQLIADSTVSTSLYRAISAGKVDACALDFWTLVGANAYSQQSSVDACHRLLVTIPTKSESLSSIGDASPH